MPGSRAPRPYRAVVRLAAVLTTIGACATMAGCARPVSQPTYEAYQEALASPGFFQQGFAKCVASVRQGFGLGDRYARLANVPKDRAPEIVCERLLRATREGRLTYEQYVEGLKGNETAERTRIIQGG